MLNADLIFLILTVQTSRVDSV